MLRRRAMVGRPVARVGRAVVGHGSRRRHCRCSPPPPAKEVRATRCCRAATVRSGLSAGCSRCAGPAVCSTARAVRSPVEQAPAPDLTAQLQQLADLHSSGVLSDEEFAAAKQKLLAS